MARIRTIKPEFFRAYDLYQAEAAANKGRTTGYLNIRIAFAGLITVADREGRFRWRPEQLKLDCLPYDVVDFSEVLAALSAGEDPFIVRYEAPSGLYGWIPGFTAHQRPHPAEAQSILPPPPAEVQSKFNRTSGECQLTLGIGTDKGKGTEVASSPDGSAQPPSKAFLSFPCIGLPDSWVLTDLKVAEYRATYTGVVVESECRKAWQWCQDNPSRRKTAKGMPRFLSTWLGRAQDRGWGAKAGSADVKSKMRGVPEGRIVA